MISSSFQSLILACLFTLSCTVESKEIRDGRVFSLFNIVKFQNALCSSSSSLSNGAATRMGTCMTSIECQTSGGQVNGDCAAGFGACCVYLVSECGATVDRNSTYVRNPSFPQPHEGTSQCGYTVQKSQSEVCQLRLDFVTFSLLGPNGSDEVVGGLCNDTFVVSGTNIGSLTPTICGQNTGQHIYVDIGQEPGDSASISFNFNGISVIRKWEIGVSQIACHSSHRAPQGCLQYFTGPRGRITTFNFLTGDSPTAGIHLGRLNYNSCLRREEGMCCVRYAPCADEPNPFSLSRASTLTAFQEEECTSDYVFIEGATADCGRGGGFVTSRFCGGHLSVVLGLPVDGEVCDCSPPFMVGIVTDDMAEPPPPVDVRERGVCLDYNQTPCGGV